LTQLAELKTFRQFDNAITAPLHGFRNVDDYYTRSSSRQYLHRIRVPTLIIHALDDPFLPADAIPSDKDLAPSVTLELSPHGGHVGFVAGSHPGKAQYWLESRICERLRKHL
jgi:predicted alpha/beta-fold hydrolase